MQYNADTRLQELVDTYPWLIDEISALDPRLKAIKTPFGRAMIRRSTVADASRISGYPVERLLQELNRVIGEHNAKD